MRPNYGNDYSRSLPITPHERFVRAVTVGRKKENEGGGEKKKGKRRILKTMNFGFKSNVENR